MSGRGCERHRVTHKLGVPLIPVAPPLSQGSWFRVPGSGFRGERLRLGFRVEGLGFVV